jgi:A/G-specific adenine glycosylase
MSARRPPAPPPPDFAKRVIAWQRRDGRRELPWQGTRDAYRIWVSEIMLQQTQVASAIPYFERFVARFPDVSALAAASGEEVMRLWSGLGYYARARNLHEAARLVAQEHGGRFPIALEEIDALPGIGRSTAAAIAAFATGAPHAILDANVKRVLARHEGIAGAVDSAPTLARLWAAAQRLLPERGIEPYTQGLMDLGATLCTRSLPACDRCPVAATCVAFREGRIEELPGARKARAVPRREAVLLVLHSRGEVLLEKRPPRGIWGGLWSVPEAPAGSEPVAWARRHLGVSTRGATPLPAFVHAFTHFTLTIRPLLVSVAGVRRAPAGRHTIWLPLTEVGHAALPAPVKRLLAGLATDEPTRAGAARGESGAGSRGGRRRR